MSRSNKIQRDSFNYVRSERVDWIDQFADSIEKASKTAVEVARERNQSSIQDQINSIINNKPANSHHTVEGIVQEMQERAGLKQYLQSMIDDKSSKTAEQKLFPKLSDDIEDNIKIYIENNVKTHRGQITVPAVQYDILSVFKNSGLMPEDVDSLVVGTYINNIIAREQQMNTTQFTSPDIGKGVGVIDVDHNDSNNTDFMKGMMPNND